MATEQQVELISAAYAAGIASKKELANFMAQVTQESSGLTRLSESFVYSKGLDHIPVRSVRDNPVEGEAARLEALHGRPEKLAEMMYGGRMGNDQPGDGYKYRGRGYIQLTGKDNYRAAGNALGLDLLENPDLAATRENAVKLSIWFWNENVHNVAPEDIDRATHIINIGNEGIDQRRSYFSEWQNKLTPEVMNELAQGQTPLSLGEETVSSEHQVQRHKANVVYGQDDAVAATTELQTHLRSLGYSDANGHALSVDGHYGKHTRHALETFQRNNGLSADGIAGPNTLEVLRTRQQMLGRAPAFVPELEGNPQTQRDTDLAHQAPMPRDMRQPAMPAIHASSPAPSLAAAPSQAPREQHATEVALVAQQAIVDQHIILQQRVAAEEKEAERVVEAHASQERAVAPIPSTTLAPVSPATPPDLDATAIRGVQQHLSVLGMTDYRGQALPVTGTYDASTRNAVIGFQQEHGLPGTGLADPATRALIEAHATIANLQRPERADLATQLDRAGPDEALRPSVAAVAALEPAMISHAHPNARRALDPGAHDQVIDTAGSSLDDPRNSRSPLHALYNELKTRVPDASENRLLQFTAACHACKITEENLGRIHFDEQRGHIMFTASWPPGPYAEVDVKVPSPEPHQSIQSIQHYDQSQAQMMSEFRAQNAQIEAQAQQGPGLGGPMR